MSKNLLDLALLLIPNVFKPFLNVPSAILSSLAIFRMDLLGVLRTLALIFAMLAFVN